MKKLFFVSLFALTAYTMNAQIKFGIKAGANFSKFSGSDAKIGDLSPKYRIGLAGGGLVNIPVNEMFSVQPEVLYSMEGAKYEESGEKAVYKTDYINIPVMFQYNASGFYGETGPQVGFLISAKGDNGDVSVDIKDNFKSINFAWGVGLGYKMTNGFGVGARYNIGIANIADDDDDDTNIKLGGFHLGVFYTFGGSSN